MTISSLIGSRLLTGIAAFALSGSLIGGTAMAAQPDSPVREIRHEVRDQSKAQREEIKQLRGEFAAEYAKDRPDTQKLERLHTAIEAKRAEINALRFEALMKMHDELDAEQRQRMAERMAHEGKRHKNRGEHDREGKADGAKGKNKGKDKRAKRGERGEPEMAGKAKVDKPNRGKAKAKVDKPAKAKRSEPAPV